MPASNGSATPPPRIGKIGPYTVFLTPSPTATPKPEPSEVQIPPVQLPSPPPVMAPPSLLGKEKQQKASSLSFFWDAVAKVQNAHSSLDEHISHWFGLNQSKYQWALDDYNNQSNEKQKSDAK
ncbi:hydroxyproline-rich glycoprotein family protein, partial [Genlisea aurea]